MDFREALLELHRENMFPLRTIDIEYELEDVPRRFYMKNDVYPSSQFYYFVFVVHILISLLFLLSSTMHTLLTLMER